MFNAKTWMLGAAVLASTLGLAAPQAQAARIGIYVGGPVAYVPPCPGPGYFWTAGYYANGYWVPGRWAFRGVVAPNGFYGHYDRGPVFDRDRHFDRGGFRGHDRH
jgi:hypothetical protein